MGSFMSSMGSILGYVIGYSLIYPFHYILDTSLLRSIEKLMSILRLAGFVNVQQVKVSLIKWVWFYIIYN